MYCTACNVGEFSEEVYFDALHSPSLSLSALQQSMRSPATTSSAPPVPQPSAPQSQAPPLPAHLMPRMQPPPPHSQAPGPGLHGPPLLPTSGPPPTQPTYTAFPPPSMGGYNPFGMPSYFRPPLMVSSGGPPPHQLPPRQHQVHMQYHLHVRAVCEYVVCSV